MNPDDPHNFYPAHPTAETVDAMRHVRDVYASAAEMLERECRPSRHRQLALTALEESSMWAIKALSHDPANQEDRA